MELIVVKRDGAEVPYDKLKIIRAIEKALLEVDGNLDYSYLADNAAQSVENYLKYYDVACITVEEIQDLVEDTLLKSKFNNSLQTTSYLSCSFFIVSIRNILSFLYSLNPLI